MTPKTILGVAIIVALLVGGAAFWVFLHAPAPSAADRPEELTINPSSGNYGLFIDNRDNNYFSTTDANVRKIIEAYLADRGPNATTDADKYGSYIVYFYNQDIFIAGHKHSFDGPVATFIMHDMKTGRAAGDCMIFPSPGWYKDSDLLLSVSHKGSGVDVQQGVCFYERGAPGFTFIDLTPKLSDGETLFSDPHGQDQIGRTQDIDTQKRTFSVGVYDMEGSDASGRRPQKRNLEVTY